jgi:hypothetical protein
MVKVDCKKGMALEVKLERWLEADCRNTKQRKGGENYG